MLNSETPTTPAPAQNGQNRALTQSCSCDQPTSINAGQPISDGRLVNSARV